MKGFKGKARSAAGSAAAVADEPKGPYDAVRRSIGRKKSRAKKKVTCKCGCGRKFNPLYVGTPQEQVFFEESCKVLFHNNERMRYVRLGRKAEEMGVKG